MLRVFSQLFLAGDMFATINDPFADHNAQISIYDAPKNVMNDCGCIYVSTLLEAYQRPLMVRAHLNSSGCKPRNQEKYCLKS